MPDVITLKATDGTTVQYVDEIIGSGGMKDVYFSPDRSYVVAFFRDPQNATSRDRLETIVGRYRQQIFEDAGGEYWKDLFCWPTKIVEFKGKLGIVAPTYKPEFFFGHGSKNNDFLGIKGKEKQGKWFASAHNRSKFLDPRELGNWRSYLTTCIKICRAVHRMHAAGLAHSDLSYRNVLVDPAGGHACIIDIDGLVVPGKFPPDVIGTADFIAPEVIATSLLPRDDPRRCLPRIETDRHALSVLIYMYLFYRHPLNGAKVHDPDPAKDEALSKGINALFAEHPTDPSNRPRIANARPSELPWADITKRPYTIAGPYLKELFDQAFIAGMPGASRSGTSSTIRPGPSARSATPPSRATCRSSTSTRRGARGSSGRTTTGSWSTATSTSTPGTPTGTSFPASGSRPTRRSPSGTSRSTRVAGPSSTSGCRRSRT